MRILYAGDAAEEEPELHRQREHLIEPSRTDATRFKTVKPRLPMMTFDWTRASVVDAPPLEIEDWERILLAEDGIEYYAWQNVRTGKIFV